MTNLKALAVTERAALSNTLFENPELTAMAAICELLQELPDDASRMRVMHWAFGKFAPEFKRQGAAPAISAPAAPSRTPLAPVTPVVAAPIAAPVTTPASPEEDFERQVSELDDLFPSGERLPRAAFADTF